MKFNIKDKVKIIGCVMSGFIDGLIKGLLLIWLTREVFFN